MSHERIYNKKYMRLYLYRERIYKVMNEHVFALDIGTQSVTGIVLHKHEQTFTVSDFHTEQHEERAMLDGQIQDVVQVANVITKVKEHLENKHGPLERVYVAAAGRALKTVQTTITIPIHERPITTEEQIKHIELSAVQQAQYELAEQRENNFHDYHCVGYSVVHYKLDGDIIGSFIDQTGDEVSVEVIATFLPKVVVESLMAALERTHLTMDALTLEPIAAIHVLVPESMRRLNVALIDIGAGTSDLAISNDGTITAYGMVPVAGDEITEEISDHFLLDFKLAETLKRQVVDEKSATVKDILGFDVEVTYDELLSIIEKRTDYLAKLLADKVKELNHDSPQAVMLIGGGSLTPLIDEKIATYLDLPANRVAVRGSEAIHFVDNTEEIPSGPDFVTPIGIAISAAENPFQYMNVFVNDKKILLFTMEELTVGNCFLQAGINLNEYYGKIGLAYFVTINGEDISIPGFYGGEPHITINGQAATVDSIVKADDRIHIVKGEDGESPTVTIKELIGNIEPLQCRINNQPYIIQPIYKANDELIDEHYIVKDKDQLLAKVPRTVEEVLDSIQMKQMIHQALQIFLDGRKITFEQTGNQMLLDGVEVSLTSPMKNGSHLEIAPAQTVTVQDLLDQLKEQLYYQIHVSFNGQPITLRQRILNIKRGDERLSPEDVLYENDQLTTERETQRNFIFQDVFRYVNFDISSIQTQYRILCNDEEVRFHHEIQTGDRLELEIQ